MAPKLGTGLRAYALVRRSAGNPISTSSATAPSRLHAAPP